MRRMLIAAAVTRAAIAPAAAQVSWEGKNIRLIVTSAAGTSYDSYARVAARHLTRYIPGKPNVIVQNLPGAGGIVGANQLYALAEKDGTQMALLNRNALIQPIVGNKQARYKSEEFYWLGTASSYKDDPYLFVIHGKQPYKTAEEIRKATKPVQVGNSGSVMVTLIKEITGLNVNIVDGYDKNVLDLAFLRGEVDGIGVAYTNVLARFPGAFEKGEIRAIIQYGNDTRSKVLPDVPTARELALTPEGKALMGFVEAPLSIPYPYTLPPGVPADRASAMRKAFDELWADADYKVEIESQKLLHAPKTGAEVQAEVAELARAPASVIKRYSELAGKMGE